MSGPLDVSDVINELAVDVTLLRRGVPVVLDGDVMPGPVIASAIRVGTHPTKGDAADFLPEGIRTNALRAFYSTVELRTFKEPDGHDADILVYQGSRFELIKAEPWYEGGFWRAFGVQMAKNAAIRNVYFGVEPTPVAVNEAFVLALTGVLPQASREALCAVNIEDPDLFWFAVPATFGVPDFTVDDVALEMTSVEVSVGGVTYDVWSTTATDLGDVIARVE